MSVWSATQRLRRLGMTTGSHVSRNRSMKYTLMAASLLSLVSTFALAQNRDINLEPECGNTGSGMDPRCVGDTNPGTVTDFTTARQEDVIETAPAQPVVTA